MGFNANLDKSARRVWLIDHVNYNGSGCLMWPFSIVRGYGTFMWFRKHYYAYKFMCELGHGPAPTTAHHAAHSCGNGHLGCVHPKHLWWKMPSENAQDKLGHGTCPRGWQRKLKPHDVVQIRALKGQKTQDEIAAMFGVGRRNIGAIHSGRSWASLHE